MDQSNKEFLPSGDLLGQVRQLDGNTRALENLVNGVRRNRGHKEDFLRGVFPDRKRQKAT